MKKLIKKCIVVCFYVVLTIPSATFAQEIKSDSEIDTFSETEFNVYQDLKRLSTEELLASGCSQEDVQIIQETTYEELLFERAQLPEETLAAYGYTTEQIDILKDYDGEPITEDSNVAALLATCTGKITCSFANTKYVNLTYAWQWSSVPLWVWTDSVALNWRVIDADGRTLNASATNKTLSVDYYKGSTFNKTISYLLRTETNFDTIIGEFKMQLTEGTVNPQALRGRLNTSIQVDGNAPLALVKVAAGYGHCTVTGNIGFGITTSGDVGFHFTPAMSVQRLAYDRVQITSSGNVTNLD